MSVCLSVQLPCRLFVKLKASVALQLPLLLLLLAANVVVVAAAVVVGIITVAAITIVVVVLVVVGVHRYWHYWLRSAQDFQLVLLGCTKHSIDLSLSLLLLFLFLSACSRCRRCCCCCCFGNCPFDFYTFMLNFCIEAAPSLVHSGCDCF